MRTDLMWRAVPPVGAILALLLDARAPLPGVLALVGLALAAERVARLRALGLADRVLVGVGGSLVVLVLTGILLGSTGIGLRPVTWTVALAVLAVTGLVVARTVPPRAAQPREVATHARTALLLVPWIAVSVAVVVVSIQVSATSLSRADRDPVEMSLGRVTATQVEVLVRSSESVGPLEVRTATEGNEVSYPLFTVAEDGTNATTVSLPRTGRFVITVNYPDQTQPLRTLVLDR